MCSRLPVSLIRNSIGNARNDATSIRVTAENYVRKLFPFNEIHDIREYESSFGVRFNAE
jgi:hypothetical protein